MFIKHLFLRIKLRIVTMIIRNIHLFVTKTVNLFYKYSHKNSKLILKAIFYEV